MHEPSQRPSLLLYSLVPEAPCLFVNICGELDLCGAQDMPQDEYCSRPDLTTVLVDLGELTFCDATGIRALLAFRRVHEAQGRTVTVVLASPFILRLMRLCGISDQLEATPPADTLV